VRLVGSDYLVIVSVLMLLGAHWITMFMIGYYRSAAESVEQAEAVVQAFESNPFMAWVLNITKVNFMLSIVVVPAYVLTLYVLARRYLINRNPELLGMVALLVFFITFLDFTHDLSILLGTLAGNGWGL